MVNVIPMRLSRAMQCLKPTLEGPAGGVQGLLWPSMPRLRVFDGPAGRPTADRNQGFDGLSCPRFLMHQHRPRYWSLMVQQAALLAFDGPAGRAIGL